MPSLSGTIIKMVSWTRFEPLAFALQDRRFNQLSQKFHSRTALLCRFNSKTKLRNAWNVQERNMAHTVSPTTQGTRCSSRVRMLPVEMPTALADAHFANVTKCSLKCSATMPLSTRRDTTFSKAGSLWTSVFEVVKYLDLNQSVVAATATPLSSTIHWSNSAAPMARLLFTECAQKKKR